MSDTAATVMRARTAKRILGVSSSKMRSDALLAMADVIFARRAQIIASNACDLADAKKLGLSEALLDRLTLTQDRIDDMCGSIRKIAAFDEPLGTVLEKKKLENGLRLEKVTVPIGVIAVIFEARPNVAADSAALCIKSGNAVILRGGKEALNSNRALTEAMRDAVESVGLSRDVISFIEDTSHESANELMRMKGIIDLLIPRGSARLIDAVVKNSTVPVIETGAGTCHIYIDEDADLAMAAKIVYNAKTSRPSVCNACECILVNRKIAPRFLPQAEALLAEKSVELRADREALGLLKNAVAAAEDDWGREYNDYILACRVVGDVNEAIEHIERYGTGHSEAIVTKNEKTAEYFLANVDAAAVYVNASTRFTDGGVFGLGAEIGISTQKLHARGPLGLRELTSYKYLIRGDGQIR
ncbi:MAG: glutamate-5-semialdehyde dehydrogenase [Oscillospiraceae bacterium]